MKRILFLIIVLFLTIGCQQSLLKRSTTVSPADQIVSASINTPSDFPQEISRLEQLTLGKDKNKPDTWLKLSLLYSHHQNPAPDHTKALSSLEQYLNLSKIKKQPEFIYDRLSLLRNIVKLNNEDYIELMRQDNRTLMLENQKLKDEMETLQNENLAMRQMLERLGQIELQHEKKRKQIK